MYCGKCGKNIPDGVKACTFCGATQEGGQRGNAQTNSGDSYSQAITAPILTLGDYIIMMIIMMIPVVNIVMLCMWAFGSEANPNKRNFAKAQLIFMVISVILCLLFFSSIIAMFASLSYL